MSRRVSLLAGLAVVLLPVVAQAQTPTAASVLDANRAAMGETPAQGTLKLDYAYSGSGMSGTMTEVSDVASGAFADSYDLGPTSGGGGFDGTTPWMRDLSGAFTPEEGGDRVVLAVNEAYRRANLWWRADRGGAEIVYVSLDVEGGVPLHHLAVTPKGGERFDAWFDVSTHMLARIAEPQGFFHTRTLYADWRREGPVMAAHAIILDGGTGEANYEQLKLTGAKVEAPRPLAAYAWSKAPPAGVTIDGGLASVTLPFRLLNNHIYVQATVNGRGPFTFIVDTGGHTLLGAKVVKAAALDSQGQGVESGAGEKLATDGFAKVREIAVGPVKMHDQTGITTEIYDPSIEGIPVDGMVGFELFRRLAVRIDYGAQTITFIDPARFDPKGAGVELSFKFYDHMPQVTGRVAELPARFNIDTGSRSEVDLTSPFVARADLKARFGKGVEALTGWGAGGAVIAHVVRLPSLALGPVEVSKPTGELSEAKGGSFSDPNYEGNIGSALLKRFVVTFDYAHQRMYLKRIEPQPADAGAFDRSGMWINAADGGFKVTSLSKGGAAEAAGLKADDVITSIDGKPAVTDQLSDARALLRDRPAGSTVQLDVRRGGETRKVALVLRDQV